MEHGYFGEVQIRTHIKAVPQVVFCGDLGRQNRSEATPIPKLESSCCRVGSLSPSRLRISGCCS